MNRVRALGGNCRYVAGSMLLAVLPFVMQGAGLAATGDYRLPDKAIVIQGVPGYNSWPMIQAIGSRLVCGYSRGTAHTITEPRRHAYAKYSTDGGFTWSNEYVTCADPTLGECNEGAGLDATGAGLFWIRCWGPKDHHHDLYRTHDGVTFTKIAVTHLDPFPMQVMDLVNVSGLGLVSLWFAGNYKKDGGNSWGMLTSTDNGHTWQQRIIEKGLSVKEWVTEPTLVDLGRGRLFIIARCEKGLGTLFQVTSTDGGQTWRKRRTNIGDVLESTPSLLYSPHEQKFSLYYYHRGARLLKRREANVAAIFDHPQDWPVPEVLDRGYETRAWDAGNVKATRMGNVDICAWYTGTPSNTAIVLTRVVNTNRLDTGVLKYVDPRIGTAGGGNTFPGPVWPLGMIQPGPDTAVKAATSDYGSSENGYNPSSDQLMGFTQTHLSGTGCCDLQDFLLLPFAGMFPPGTNRPLVRINKQTEETHPGYYAVTYTDDSVTAELTCSRRVAYHRYTFTKGQDAHVFVDMQAGPVAWWRMNDPAYPRHRVVESAAAFSPEGILTARNVVTCWNDDRVIACQITFSPRPIAIRELPPNGRKGKRWVLDFALPNGGCVCVKAAVSGVDIEGARANWDADPVTFDFDACRAACSAAWQRLLSRVAAHGTPEQLTTFYTALYHAYVQPNLLSDVDGRVRFSMNRPHAKTAVVTIPKGEAYTTFSEWDTFRATHPLYTILTPYVVDDFVQSFLATYRAVGYLPKWQIFGGENKCMIGVHSIPVMADAYLKGLTSASPAEMLEAAVSSLKQERDTALYDKLGYLPMTQGRSVSSTLEFGIDDWAMARLAEKAGDNACRDLSDQRAQYYRNLFDSTTGCMRARDGQGTWRTPFDPYKQRPSPEDIKQGIPNDYTEGGAWQYACHVLQDPQGLMALHGGREKFAAFLTRLFSDTTQTAHATGECSGRIGQFALGNEHDQHVPYLWQYAGHPERTAEIIRELCTRYFSTQTNGLCGNDDCGQISAWYVFACLGFYPVNPCGGTYVLGAPQLPHVDLHLADGKAFTIIAKNLSTENKYVKRVTLNGQPFVGFELRHADIMKGGELVFEMGAR